MLSQQVVGSKNCYRVGSQFWSSFLKDKVMSSILSMVRFHDVWEVYTSLFLQFNFVHVMGLLGCGCVFVSMHLVSLDWTIV